MTARYALYIMNTELTTSVTSGAALAERLKSTKLLFTLPVLDITIQYRKPDFLKLSFNKSLPEGLAAQIIEVYRAQVKGEGDQYTKDMQNKPLDIDDQFLKDLREKGYTLLKELCTSHKILDVPQSDPDNDVISWTDIPEQDAISFLLHLIESAQTAKTKAGGEISQAEVADFPDGKPVRKRNTARAHGKDVREVA